ncbi:histidine phosphatase family protein [Bacillus sp. DJP31]|uniref:histidine phosphatase family protein n=1 Tax=Bacillus sp. DJP31 TaxID=3409789 RepID=UPI003BB6CBF5
MTTVFLIRHGETDWNVQGRLQGIQDTSLNENGTKQAHACGLFLKDLEWDVLISSPMKRAKETAYAINEHIKQEMVFEIEELKELDFGEGSGMTKEELALAFPDGVIAGMENRDSFAERTMSALSKVLNDHSNKKVIVVAHGAVINSMLSVISNGEMGHGKSRVDNGGITELHYNGEKWTITSHNKVDHLLLKK